MVCRDSDHVIIANDIRLYEYSISNDVWSDFCHEIPTVKFALAVYKSMILLIGGEIRQSTRSYLKPEISDKIWCLDDKLGWLESSISPMPIKLFVKAAVADGDLLIIAGVTPPVTCNIFLCIFHCGCWLTTKHLKYNWIHVSNIRLMICDTRLYLFVDGMNVIGVCDWSQPLFAFLYIQSLLRESKTVVDFKWSEIDLPSRYQESFEPTFESTRFEAAFFVSNPTAFNKCLNALALGGDRQTLSLYAHHSNKWRRELSIHLPKVLAIQNNSDIYSMMLPERNSTMVMAHNVAFWVSIDGEL